MTMAMAGLLLAGVIAGWIWLHRTQRIDRRRKLPVYILLGCAGAALVIYCILTLLLIGGID